MADLNGFNAAQFEPKVGGYDPIPEGKYLAVVTASSMKETKNGAGRYLELTFQVIEGPLKSSNVWARLNLQHENEKTVKLARQELSAICHALGVLAPKDSIELHDIPLVISVALKKRKDNGEPTNVIKAYEKRGAAAKPTTAGPAAMGPGAPGSNGKAPWEK